MVTLFTIGQLQGVLENPKKKTLNFNRYNSETRANNHHG